MTFLTLFSWGNKDFFFFKWTYCINTLQNLGGGAREKGTVNAKENKRKNGNPTPPPSNRETGCSGRVIAAGPLRARKILLSIVAQNTLPFLTLPSAGSQDTPSLQTFTITGTQSWAPVVVPLKGSFFTAVFAFPLMARSNIQKFPSHPASL